MPPAMKRLLADLQLPAYHFDRRALVEVHFRLTQFRNDLLRRVSLPFHRVLPPFRALDSHISWYIGRGSGHRHLAQSRREPIGELWLSQRMALKDKDLLGCFALGAIACGSHFGQSYRPDPIGIP